MQNIVTFGRMFKQLIQILNSRQKRGAMGIAFLSMIIAFLETLGIGVIIPFIMAMMTPQAIIENKYISKVLSLLDISDEKEVIFLMGIVIVSIYLLKNAFIVFGNFIQSRYRNELEKELSVQMLKSYLYKPYLYHVNTNSSEIMRGISSDMSGVASVVDGYCTFVTEGLTCILLGVMLIVLNPLMAISLMLLAGLTAIVVVLGLRKQIARCGVECREAFASRYKSAYQSIEGIKDIDVMKRQSFFLDTFSCVASKASKYNTRYLWLSKLPSRVIEVVFISGLIGIVCLCIRADQNVTVLITQFGTLAVASVRILPSISSLSSAMNSLVYNRPSLEAAYENIISVRSEEIVDFCEDIDALDNELISNIAIKDICWRYSDKLDDVITDISLIIKKGESIALIGESGAGKSTLADIILGLYIPQKGMITVDGKSIYEQSTKWHRMIGYVPQTVFLLDDTVRNNILFGIPHNQIDESQLACAIKQAQLTRFIDSLPQGLDTVLGERGVKISGGQRQRIAIARALYYNPDILVLDEATSALDNDTEAAVMEAINTLHGEKTLIIVAHRLSTISGCDHIYEIADGKLHERSKKELFGQSDYR